MRRSRASRKGRQCYGPWSTRPDIGLDFAATDCSSSVQDCCFKKNMMNNLPSKVRHWKNSWRLNACKRNMNTWYTRYLKTKNTSTVRPVLMGTVSWNFVFSGAIIIQLGYSQGLCSKLLRWSKFSRSFKRYAPIRPNIRNGAHLWKLSKRSSIVKTSGTSPLQFQVKIIIVPLKQTFTKFKIPFPLA